MTCGRAGWAVAALLVVAGATARPARAQGTAAAPVAGPAAATPITRALVVFDRDAGPARAALVALARVLPVDKLSVDAPDLAARLAARAPGTVALALGPRAAAKIAASRAPRAAALVRAAEAPASVPAVVLEAPLAAALPVLARTFPGRTRVLVVGRVVDAAPALAAAARAAGLTIEVVAAPRADVAVPALERALATDRRRTIVWLAPDAEVVTGDVVAPLVRAALAARVPLIGFSRYFLSAGALGAVSVDYGAASTRALTLASAAGAPHEPPSTTLVVDGRRAERLGVVVKGGPGVEVSR